MNKTMTIVISLAVLFGGFFIFYHGTTKEKAAPIVNQAPEQTGTNQHWAPKTDDQASITTVVTPNDILSQSKEWKFDIAMNTHSIELPSPMESFVLVDDLGREYKPTSWNGPTSGHHMNGTLVFNQVSPIPKSIELKISGIDKNVRSFVW